MATLLLLSASPLATVHAGSLPQLLAVPDVRQATDYTCGPSALQAVLAYWGIEAREDELAKACLTTSAAGTNRHALIRVARSYGLRTIAHAPMSDATLRRYLQQGYPVILAIQAWNGTARPDYANNWEDGHYVVAIGYDRQRLYLEDPSLLGSRGWLSFRELDARWHDSDFGPQDRYQRLGIACIGKRRARWTASEHVD
jgi:predicted double-glycine peptidase